MDWTRAPRSLRDFNGLRRVATVGTREVGVFRERYPSYGRYWTVRARIPNAGWGFPIHHDTSMRKAVAWVDGYLQ